MGSSVVKIVETQVEKFNLKQAWFVKAYKIVDAQTGEDKVQPYFTGRKAKKEALEFCKKLNYILKF